MVMQKIPAVADEIGVAGVLIDGGAEQPLCKPVDREEDIKADDVVIKCLCGAACEGGNLSAFRVRGRVQQRGMVFRYRQYTDGNGDDQKSHSRYGGGDVLGLLGKFGNHHIRN